MVPGGRYRAVAVADRVEAERQISRKSSAGGVIASGSVRIAVITALRSPRTPFVSLNAAATRPTSRVCAKKTIAIPGEVSTFAL